MDNHNIKSSLNEIHFVFQCDYRGTPRFFNPLEQMSLGQATFLFGCLAYELKQSDENTYLSSVWVAGMVCKFHLLHTEIDT